MLFPVLAFKEDHDKALYGISTDRRLRTTSVRLLKSGIYNGVHLIDENGNVYKIMKARQKGWARPFWGFNPLLKSRQIRVELDIESVRTDTLEQVRAFVLNRLTTNKKHELTEEWIQTVKSAKKIAEIINVFV